MSVTDWNHKAFARLTSGGMCNAPHPTLPVGDVYCRRLAGHPDDYHAAFVHSIKTPETWPVEEVAL